MTRRQSVPLAPTIVWLSVVLCALLASLVGDGAQIAVVALGVVVALFALDAPIPSRLLTALAMVPAATMGSGEVWMWAAAGVCIGLATSLVRPAAVPAAIASQSDLQRHLEWCRRREEPAHVLVVPFSDAQVPDPFQLLQCFRVTDSVALSRSVDGFSSMRSSTTRTSSGRDWRSGSASGAATASISAAATFPEDGVTIQALSSTLRRAWLSAPPRIFPSSKQL